MSQLAPMQNVRELWNRVVTFFRITVWQVRRDERPAIQWLLIRLVRTGILTFQGFTRHNGPMRASALTFFTLLSLVPVAALAFGIAKGFGLEKRLQQDLLNNFAAQQEVVKQIIEFAEKMLDNTRGDMIAGVGVVVLFWAVIKVLSHIENSFNHIWGVSSRPMVRKLSDYLTIMVVCPLLVVMSSSMTVYISHQVLAISGRLELPQLMDPAIYTGLKLLPYALIWVLFTFVYIIMPNTHVPFSSALLAGVLAGSAYQVVQGVYIQLQINVAQYNAIYGSFAALPLFLTWLQASWLIVILGAEISHAFRNSAFVDQTDGGRKMSVYQTRLMALAVCRHVVQRFQQGRPAQTTRQIAGALALSPVLVDNLADLLIQGDILVRIDSGKSPGSALQPARDIGSLTANAVVTALDEVGSSDRPMPYLSAGGSLSKTLAAFRKELDQSDANRLVKEL
jgi:membrane protein